MSTETTAPDDGSDSASLERRDRLVAALLAEDPELLLMRYEPAEASLLGTGDPFRVVVLKAPSGVTADALEKALTEAAQAVTQKSPPTHFVVVGGGEETSAALRRAGPGGKVATTGFHHVSDGAALTHEKGLRLPLLERAFAKMAEAKPLSVEDRGAALAKGADYAEKARALANNLSGKANATRAITAACVVLFALGYHWGKDAFDPALDAMGANHGQDVLAGEVYRLLASAFLHHDPIHLVVNMIALWSFGVLLETVLGSRRYVILYAASALGGSLASAMLRPDTFSVGASGAIWGLMGAGIGLVLRPKGVLPPAMVKLMRGRVWVPLVLNLLISFSPRIDMLAHLGGGIVGFLLAATVLTDGIKPVVLRADPTDVEKGKAPIVNALSALFVFAMGASIVAALAFGRPWALNDTTSAERVKIGDTGVSVELPRTLAKSPEMDQDGGATVARFGRLKAPVALEVSVARYEEPLPEGEIEESLDRIREQEDGPPPTGTKKTKPAARVKVGPHRAVATEVEGEGGTVKTLFLVTAGYEVRIRGTARVRPEAWRGLEEKVAASITVP